MTIFNLVPTIRHYKFSAFVQYQSHEASKNFFNVLKVFILSCVYFVVCLFVFLKSHYIVFIFTAN